jgi:hypothetical protein
LSDERRDYAILVRLYMREEAEVMASALRAEGIDAFIGNRHHANVDWGWTIALGGLQVMAPRDRIDDAKAVLRARWQEATENPEGEPVKRRDRWKVWLVIVATLLLPWGVMSTAHTLDQNLNMLAFQHQLVEWEREQAELDSIHCPSPDEEPLVWPGDDQVVCAKVAQSVPLSRTDTIDDLRNRE